MLKEAASAGIYHSTHDGQDYPKLQILTIEQLLSGTKPRLPPLVKSPHKQARDQLKEDEKGEQFGEQLELAA